MDFDDLKHAIESQYGGTATRLQSVSKAYAWSSPIEGSTKRRYSAVLHMGGITCPQDAVRAAIVAEHRSRDV